MKVTLIITDDKGKNLRTCRVNFSELQSLVKELTEDGVELKPTDEEQNAIDYITPFHELDNRNQND